MCNLGPEEPSLPPSSISSGQGIEGYCAIVSELHQKRQEESKHLPLSK